MKLKEQNPFNDSELTTILVVSDINISKSFYIHVLGAELFREYGGTSLVLKFLNNCVLLVTAVEPTTDKSDISFDPPGEKNSVSHSFTIRVNDCQKSYEILKEKGTDFITPPYNWGAETRCFFQDPDGHLFEISEFREK